MQEDRLAKGELRRERDLMLKGLLTPSCTDDTTGYDNDMSADDSPTTNGKATPRMTKKVN